NFILPFKNNHHELTLGVELELQVLNGESFLLSPSASAIIEKAKQTKFKQEFFQSTLEVITPVCGGIHDIEKELSILVSQAHKTTESLSLKLSSTGTHPFADYRDRLITPSLRYFSLIGRNQWLIRRMAVYGMHI